jgi:putative salt-induced outer membrane protein
MRYAALVGLSMALSSGAHAEWNGKGELGFVMARGNTNTETVTAKADMSSEADPWKHSVGFSILQSTSEHVETADRYEVHGQSDYKLTAQAYALGALRYERDQFSPYTYQAVAALGVGYKLFDSDTTKLATELGVGYRRAEDRLARQTEGDIIFRGGLNYAQQLTESTHVYDKLLVESGGDNTFTQNELGVKVAINSSLALSVAHVLRHNSDVIAPAKSTDQLVTASLAVSF